MDEQFVKREVIKFLSNQGWGKNIQFGGLHEKGVDIKVQHNRYPRYFLIECKGQGKGKGSHETEFVYSLGQIITRMNTTGKTRYYYGLGLSVKAANVALKRLPWQLAKKLLLHVFSVTPSGKVTQYSWKELKEKQDKSSSTKPASKGRSTKSASKIKSAKPASKSRSTKSASK